MERDRIIALGTAYVDAKINSSELHLPQQRNQLPEFLDKHPEASLYPGGSIPNIIASFIKVSNSPNVKLFCCVGNDDRGRFFTENIDERLGKPKISRRKQTGVWVGIYNSGLKEGADFYGAADDYRISRRELKKIKNELFISDIDFLNSPRSFKQIQKTLKILKKDNGVFALSLGHVGHNQNPSNQENFKRILSSLHKAPDLVFGNERDLLYATGIKNFDEAIMNTFPQSRLVVITKAEKGAVIRINKKILSIPAIPVQESSIVDVQGAGDTFMASALSVLNRTPYTMWTEVNIMHAIQVASFASSLIIQSMHSSLTNEMKQQILDYEKTIKTN